MLLLLALLVHFHDRAICSDQSHLTQADLAEGLMHFRVSLSIIEESIRALPLFRAEILTPNL